MTTAVLRANDFSQLTTIRISGTVLPGKELVKELSVCRSLLHLRLSDVELSTGEETWPSVFRTLALMTKLHKLRLFVLRERTLRHNRLRFRGLKHGATGHGGKMIVYKGIEQTAAGLGELAVAPLLRETDHRAYRILFGRGGCSICGRDSD
jgi:hypothetical protein